MTELVSVYYSEIDHYYDVAKIIVDNGGDLNNVPPKSLKKELF